MSTEGPPEGAGLKMSVLQVMEEKLRMGQARGVVGFELGASVIQYPPARHLGISRDAEDMEVQQTL
jgi:hypothetical protein